MKIKELFKGIDSVVIKGSKETTITGLSNDSRLVAPGHLFIAKRGQTFHGADFIVQALESGAAAVVTDLYDPFIKEPQIIASNSAELEAILAHRFYGAPSEQLYVIGVTGTKGKTTTTYMIHHLLNALQKPCGLIGGVETLLGHERRSSTLTTHTSLQNHRWLREMISQGCQSAVIEVSSHGLEQGRVAEIAFDVAIFTNLTPDHLDYHETMEKYGAAKRKLIDQMAKGPKKQKRSLINADSPWCSFMLDQAHAWTFGTHNLADIRASDIRMSRTGTQFVVDFKSAREEFCLPVIGKFNVYNALGAIGVGLNLGHTLAEIHFALRTFPGTPGRLQSVPNNKGISVFVDHSHMGEALSNALKSLRELSPNQLICIFGAGGDRPRERRSGLAKAAEEYADLSIITSDNPRTEDPSAICQEILAGFKNQTLPIVEVDRRSAIHLGVSLAKPGDIVLIAGKGHEKVQIFAHQTVPFDDYAVATEALHA